MVPEVLKEEMGGENNVRAVRLRVDGLLEEEEAQVPAHSFGLRRSTMLDVGHVGVICIIITPSSPKPNYSTRLVAKSTR